jgi:hypothetical protein
MTGKRDPKISASLSPLVRQFSEPMDEQPPKRKGCGCGTGCLTAVAILALLGIALGAMAWHYYSKAVDTFTSTAPADLKISRPADAELASADAALSHLRDAIASNADAEIKLTAADLNVLVARHPQLRDFRGRVRFAIADSLITAETSVPLGRFPLPRLNGRWLNASVRFGLVYERGEFDLNAQSAEAGGRSIPQDVLSRGVTSVLNTNIRERMRESKKTDEGAAFWKHIKRISVQGDRLVVTIAPDASLNNP